MSFREFFFQISILTPPFLYYNRRTPPVPRFFDKLTKKKDTRKGVFLLCVYRGKIRSLDVHKVAVVDVEVPL